MAHFSDFGLSFYSLEVLAFPGNACNVLCGKVSASDNDGVVVPLYKCANLAIDAPDHFFYYFLCHLVILHVTLYLSLEIIKGTDDDVLVTVFRNLVLP